jgi:hypothetical protein
MGYLLISVCNVKLVESTGPCVKIVVHRHSWYVDVFIWFNRLLDNGLIIC